MFTSDQGIFKFPSAFRLVDLITSEDRICSAKGVSWVLVLRAGSEEPAVSWVLVLRAVGLLWAVFEARKSPNRGKVVSAKAAMEI